MPSTSNTTSRRIIATLVLVLVALAGSLLNAPSADAKDNKPEDVWVQYVRWSSIELACEQLGGTLYREGSVTPDRAVCYIHGQGLAFSCERTQNYRPGEGWEYRCEGNHGILAPTENDGHHATTPGQPPALAGATNTNTHSTQTSFGTPVTVDEITTAIIIMH